MASDCNILVIGGGINSCGVARDAAGLGCKVLFAEMDDFAGGTSSAATKLIHGRCAIWSTTSSGWCGDL